MYATLAGRVDTSIEDLAGIALLSPCDKEHILKIAEDLRRALNEAEDLYLNAEEEADD